MEEFNGLAGPGSAPDVADIALMATQVVLPIQCLAKSPDQPSNRNASIQGASGGRPTAAVAAADATPCVSQSPASRAASSDAERSPAAVVGDAKPCLEDGAVDNPGAGAALESAHHNDAAVAASAAPLSPNSPATPSDGCKALPPAASVRPCSTLPTGVSATTGPSNAAAEPVKVPSSADKAAPSSVPNEVQAPDASDAAAVEVPAAPLEPQLHAAGTAPHSQPKSEPHQPAPKLEGCMPVPKIEQHPQSPAAQTTADGQDGAALDQAIKQEGSAPCQQEMLTGMVLSGVLHGSPASSSGRKPTRSDESHPSIKHKRSLNTVSGAGGTSLSPLTDVTSGDEMYSLQGSMVEMQEEMDIIHRGTYI